MKKIRLTPNWRLLLLLEGTLLIFLAVEIGVLFTAPTALPVGIRATLSATTAIALLGWRLPAAVRAAIRSTRAPRPQAD